MSIELRETEWAERMIRDKNIGKKQYETLCRVARYYLDKGYSKNEARKKLDLFFMQSVPNASIPKNEGRLANAMKYAINNPSINIDSIVINDTELEKINKLDSRMARRVAFTLLCLAKYRLVIDANSDGWINYKDTDIMSMANLSTTLQKRCAVYRTIRDAGLIEFPNKVNGHSIHVLFVADGEPVLHITDFRNLGYQYQMYRGEPYFCCDNCGITTRIKDPKNKRRQRYCPQCAQKIKMEQSVSSVMRQRQKRKTSENV